MINEEPVPVLELSLPVALTKQIIPYTNGPKDITKEPGARIFNTNWFLLPYEGRKKNNKTDNQMMTNTAVLGSWCKIKE